MKRAHKYLIFIIVIAIAVGIIIGLTVINKKNVSGNAVSVSLQVGSSSVEYKPVIVTKENLVGFLQQQQIISDIPDSGKIMLKLYNFNSGDRQWEESYVLTKGKVEQGSVDNPDAVILIHSKYVSQLNDFCGAMKAAKLNGDLGFESGMNEAALLWKFRGLMKYKSCFGM